MKMLSRARKSKKGFYLVSPFLGFFFFSITMLIAALYINENNHQITVARAGEEHKLAFISEAIHSDAREVFFQNYLQSALDTYVVGTDKPIKTDFTRQVREIMSEDMKSTYHSLYKKAFNMSCEPTEVAWSLATIRFNGEGGANLIGTTNLINAEGKTAIWPYISHYGLQCVADEPPLESGTIFTSRWYYLDASNICAQAPGACHN